MPKRDYKDLYLDDHTVVNPTYTPIVDIKHIRLSFPMSEPTGQNDIESGGQANEGRERRKYVSCSGYTVSAMARRKRVVTVRLPIWK